MSLTNIHLSAQDAIDLIRDELENTPDWSADTLDVIYAYVAGVGPAPSPTRADGTPRMTTAQRDALWSLCGRYNVPFREDDYAKPFDLPEGYVGGWVGGYFEGRKTTIYVGVSATGEVSS